MSREGESSVDPEPEEREVVISGEGRKLDSPEDVEDTVKAINEEKELTTLRLSGNSMGVQAAQAIAGALSSRPSLRRALWNDMFVSRLRSEIPPALTTLSDAVMGARAQLVELDLSHNAFGPAGIQAIFQLLSGPACFSLRVLKLNNTGMGIQGGELLAEALKQCHSEAGREGGRLQLEVFVVGRSRLENPGASALAQVFAELGSLREVVMPQNGISKEGISALATAFAKNTGLRGIDLNDNTFTEEGAAAMATVLPSLQELRSINFGDCLLMSGGAQAIAGAIADGHQKLEEVYFGYNCMNTSSALAVADALANKKELKKIDFNGNCFGEEGCEAVRECLEAKGLADYLESLEDDEGEEEEEEEGEEEGEEGEGEGEEEGKKEEEAERDEGEGEGEEEGGGKTQVETEEEIPAEKVSVEEYLRDPSGKNLLGLGGDRAQLVATSLGESWSGEEAGRVYVKIASCYSENMSSLLKSAVEETIDAVVRPVCEAGKTSLLLNEILVQVGLLKSEDKSFVPVKSIEGPVLALTHLVRQTYFPRHCRDTLISFIQKPHQALTATRPKVLQVLYEP